MNKTKQKISNIIFLSSLILLWIICIIPILKNSNNYNQVNNRTSYKITKPTSKEFLNNNYQQQLENAISDQMPKYNYLQLLYPVMSNYLNYKTIKVLNLNHQNNYINLGNINMYHDYLVYNPIIKDDLKNYEDDLKKINYIKQKINADIYLYYINSDYNINFETNKTKDIDKYLKQKLKIGDNNIKTLTINSFEDYQKYFYKYDHHWNNRGTYQAYKEIATMMKLTDILPIKDEVCLQDRTILGSKSKSIALNKFLKEDICIYIYDYPSFTIKINNEEVEQYGANLEDLKNMTELSYATIYGSDYEEIIFENNSQNNSKKLLIYSNSYSNSINKLLASNYKYTYVIDGRYNSNFDMIKYVNEKKIDDILILANNMLFGDTIKWGDFQ